MPAAALSLGATGNLACWVLTTFIGLFTWTVLRLSLGGLFSGSSAAYAQVKAGQSDVHPFRHLSLLFFQPFLQHLKR